MRRFPIPFRLAFAGLLLLACPLAGAGLLGGNEPSFLDVDQAFEPQALLHDNGDIIVTWQIADGYYLYRHALDFHAAAPGGVVLGEPRIPEGTVHTDEFFGQVETYRQRLTVAVPVRGRADAASTPALTVTYQGCADAGLCYPPQTRTLQAMPPAAETGGFVAEQDRLATLIGNATLPWLLASFFGLGLLLALTPCVLPMIPILLGLVVGQHAGRKSGPAAGYRTGTVRSFALSTSYVVAMAAGYTVFGVFAGLFGANLQAALQSPWTLVPFAAAFVALALAMFGAFRLEPPVAWTERVTAWSRQWRGGGIGGAAAMGFLSALIVGPCVAPPLAGALLYIGASGDAALGGSALFALGLGMGAPLIALGTLGGGVLPRTGPWMREINVAFGVILLGVAVWLLGRLLPDAATLTLWAALAAGYGIRLALVRGRLASTMGAMGLGYGAILLLGAGLGATDPLRPLAPLASAAEGEARAESPFRQIPDLAGLEAALDAAADAGQPAMVDFYADWCVECVRMERTVFSQPDVRRALSSVVALQVDVTDYDTDDRRLMRAFNVLGPPTMLFYGADGSERREYRLIGGVNGEDFLRHLERALGAGMTP